MPLKMFPLKMKLKYLLQKLSCMSLQPFTDEVRLDPWPANGTLQRLLIKEEYIRWAFRTIFINVPIYMSFESKKSGATGGYFFKY